MKAKRSSFCSYMCVISVEREGNGQAQRVEGANIVSICFYSLYFFSPIFTSSISIDVTAIYNAIDCYCCLPNHNYIYLFIVVDRPEISHANQQLPSALNSSERENKNCLAKIIIIYQRNCARLHGPTELKSEHSRHASAHFMHKNSNKKLLPR